MYAYVRMLCFLEKGLSTENYMLFFLLAEVDRHLPGCYVVAPGLQGF